MNTIKLNNLELRVESYNKSTYFNGQDIVSNANCNVITSDIATLLALMEEEITSIQIFSDETLIYNLQNITARIESINEYLDGNRISVNINFNFNVNTNEEETNI